jgi:hypothetical protein
MRTLDKEVQQALTPSGALEILQHGNDRFVNNLKANRDLTATSKCNSRRTVSLCHHPQLH